MIGGKKMTYTDPDLITSALVTIDTQCDFSLPGAPAEIAGTFDIIPNMVRLLAAYRHYKLPIVHIVRLYLPDGSNVDLARRKMIVQGTRIVEPGTDGAELVPALKPSPDAKLDAGRLLNGVIQEWEQNEFVIYKSRWGAFYDTPLNDHLVRLGVTTLVVCGCNFPNCPRTTIYEASERDYRVVLVDDAVSGIYEKGKNELRNIGVHLLPTDTLMQRLGTINESER